METPVFGRKAAVFGVLLEYSYEYGKSEHAIGYSSASCTWNWAGTLGTPCSMNMGRFR